MQILMVLRNLSKGREPTQGRVAQDPRAEFFLNHYLLKLRLMSPFQKKQA